MSDTRGVRWASRTNDDSEEARSFLQSRVARFWKILFFIELVSTGLDVFDAIADPGADFLIGLAVTVQAGIAWQLCQRGRRSLRFSRSVEAGGLLISFTAKAVLGRYIVAEFGRDMPSVTQESAVLADGFISMMLLGGMAMLVALRAALIPSRPQYTVLLTAIVGVPMIAVPTLVEPTRGELLWRAATVESDLLAPVASTVLWIFVVITCTVISRVIYGLRAEVREARRLGQYVLEQKLGAGGMGEVYRARHGMMRRPSAIKLLKADRAVGAINLQRFEREVQLTARLTHPNTITIFDYGRTADNVFYYAMELLDGATLERIVAVDGAQSPGRVVRVLQMACGALAEAHGVGLIHRDIKPANIMLCSQGGELDVVKLLDFGLVKQLEADRDVKLTGANTVTGTPQYMAPESILDPDTVDARADIYALGAVAYYLLTATDVFKGQTIMEVCSKHLHQAPEPPSARGVSIGSDLEAVVLACLEKKPDDRPQNVQELRRLIDACEVEPWSADDARTWWDKHGPDLTQSEPRNLNREIPNIGELQTVSVTRFPTTSG